MHRQLVYSDVPWSTYLSFGPRFRAVFHALFVPEHVQPDDQHRAHVHVQYLKHLVHDALGRLPRAPLGVENHAQARLSRLRAKCVKTSKITIMKRHVMKYNNNYNINTSRDAARSDGVEKFFIYFFRFHRFLNTRFYILCIVHWERLIRTT